MIALGAGVDGLAIGDKVCALLPGGGYAEYVATPAAHCLPVPEGMAMKEAACLPETFFTVWSNVFTRGGLKAGERFLVHGGSSGIGHDSDPACACLWCALCSRTAGSDEKCQACLDLGAEKAINYREEDFVKVMRAEGGANLILDMVGGDYIPRNVKTLAEDGRLVQIAFLQGPKVELNFALMMVKRLTLTGSTLRPAKRSGQGADRSGSAGSGLAAVVSRQDQTGNGQRVRPCRCRSRTCPNGKARVT